MSIAKFRETGYASKNGATYRPQYRSTPSMSLVGAVMVRRGGQQPQLYRYADGRTCRHPEGEMHDCDYVIARNALIPTAEQIAADGCRRAADFEQVGFSRRFLDAMKALWNERRT